MPGTVWHTSQVLEQHARVRLHGYLGSQDTKTGMGYTRAMGRRNNGTAEAAGYDTRKGHW